MKALEHCIRTKIAVFSLSQCMPEISGSVHHCLLDTKFRVARRVSMLNIYRVEKGVTGLQCMAQHQRWSPLLVAVVIVTTFSLLTMRKACSNDFAFFLSVMQCFIAFCPFVILVNLLTRLNFPDKFVSLSVYCLEL